MDKVEERVASRVFWKLAADLVGYGLGFRFQAKGRSMLPTIQDGEFLHVQPANAAKLKVGDIVLFRSDGEFKAHRVIRKRKEFFLTRGDAGLEPETISGGEIVGKIVAIECAKTGRRAVLQGTVARLKYFSSEIRRAVSRQIGPRDLNSSRALLVPFSLIPGVLLASPRVKKHSLRLRMTLCALNSPPDLKSTISPTLRVAGSTRSTCRISPSRIVGSILRPLA